MQHPLEVEQEFALVFVEAGALFDVVAGAQQESPEQQSAEDEIFSVLHSW